MGKPLIGNAQMLAMHAAMVRLREMDRTAEPPQGAAHAVGRYVPRQIALLAAALLQLRPCDVVIADREDAMAEEVLLWAQEATFQPEHHAHLLQGGTSAASIAAGHALAQQRSTRPGDDAPVTVALLSGPSSSLADALELCSAAVLPLLAIVQGGPASQTPLIENLPNVEVVRIDADDAVACCRVVQESLLRTRNRWGSVVLQAVTLPNAADPLAAFEAHLRRRNLSF